MKAKLKPPPRPTCFGMHHSGVFRLIAIVGIAMVAIGTSMCVFQVINIIRGKNVSTSVTDPTKLLMQAIFWVVALTGNIIGLFLNIILFAQSASPNLRFLLYYTLYFMITHSIIVIYYYTLVFVGLTFPAFFSLLHGLVTYKMYICSVILRYRRDIRQQRKLQSGHRDLTDLEIGLFKDGASDKECTGPFESSTEMAHCLRYSETEFEIPQEDIDFGESTTLGLGEFGHVYKAELRRRDNNGEERVIPVAVKTVDPKLSDAHHFMALLSEVKVMTFMGKHENVVELIGVSTSEIRYRKLFIVSELCVFGNLKTYLRSNRNTFVDLLRNHKEIEVEANVGDDVICTNDLIKWSHEIACGMEYLASRKIIHGDLAPRNVLLTETITAKISDFGLSRKLYNYSVYVKREKGPLPWRSLAVEALVDLNFSIKSDVWAFGICCWEIFQLGITPWPEFPVFTLDFIQSLKDGKRLEQPAYSTKEIYEIMASCWKEFPEDRPTFSEIATRLSELRKDIEANHNI